MSFRKIGPADWVAPDAAGRNSIGSNHGLSVGDICTLADGSRFRCTAVTGAETSTWVADTAGVSWAATLAVAAITAGSNPVISAGDHVGWNDQIDSVERMQAVITGTNPNEIFELRAIDNFSAIQSTLAINTRTGALTFDEVAEFQSSMIVGSGGVGAIIDANPDADDLVVASLVTANAGMTVLLSPSGFGRYAFTDVSGAIAAELRYDAPENRLYATVGTADAWYADTSGNVTLPNANANLVVGSGTSIGVPTIIIDSEDSGSSAGDLIWRHGGALAAGAWRVRHDTAEQWILSRHNGATWDDSLLANAARDLIAQTDLYVASQLTVGATSTLFSGLAFGVGVLGTGYGTLWTDGVTDATAKATRLGVKHYTNAEEPAAFAYINSTSGGNVINFGGGTGLLNAATAQNFYTGATGTTTTGTLAGSINSAQAWTIGTDGGSAAHSVYGASITAAPNSTDLVSKAFGYYARPRTIAQGTWLAIGTNSDASNNTLGLGGLFGDDGPTLVQVYTATALDTAGTLRTTWNSAGLLTHSYNVTFGAEDLSFNMGSGLGTVSARILSATTTDAGVLYFLKDDTTPSIGDFRLHHTTAQRFQVDAFTDTGGGGANWNACIQVTSDVLMALLGDAEAAPTVAVGNTGAWDTKMLLNAGTGQQAIVQFVDSGNHFLFSDTNQQFEMAISGTQEYRFAATTFNPTGTAKTLGDSSNEWSELHLVSKTDATRDPPGQASRVIYNATDGNLNIDDGTNWILPDGTTT